MTSRTRPNISFEWSDDADLELVALEGGYSQESCGISVQSPNEGQYFLDFRNFDEDAMIRLRFPETVDEPPAPGTYTVNVDVSVDFSLPSPYGVMDGTAGDVLVEEGDGWRKVTVSADVSNGAEGGYVSAILACPM
ncbi:MAG: hypothetical protein ACI9VR_004336 [Cognaticolwellia sp.]|jgi:hypothetical protein